MDAPSLGADAVEPANTGLTAFYGEMTKMERRTFWACFAGWVLDGMDFMIYPLVIGTIINLWQVDRGVAGLAVTLTLLFSAIGGWLAGFAADRVGRGRMLQLTILWFSVFSLICAFTQNFTQLMICRAVLGLGFGGEWAAGAILIGEAVYVRNTVAAPWARCSPAGPLAGGRRADVLDRRRGPGRDLHPGADLQCRYALAGLSAGRRGFRVFLGRRGVLHRAVPDPAARLRPGLRLQFRPRHRRAVPDPGWVPSASMGLAGAIAVFAVVAYGLLLIAALLLPETRGKVLHAD